LSARNHLTGTIVGITLGEAMAVVEVRLDGTDQIIAASITKTSVGVLGLTKGADVTAIIKSTDVIIGIDS
jgi:molybdate transport system regulatory protein